MKLAQDQRRQRIAILIEQAMAENIAADLKEAMKVWLDNAFDGEKSKEAGHKLAKFLNKYAGDNKLLKQIQSMRDMFTERVDLGDRRRWPGVRYRLRRTGPRNRLEP